MGGMMSNSLAAELRFFALTSPFVTTNLGVSATVAS